MPITKIKANLVLSWSTERLMEDKLSLILAPTMIILEPKESPDVAYTVKTCCIKDTGKVTA